MCAAIEKRWTLFSSCWYLVMELKYFGTPPALRYLLFLAWRAVLSRLYEAHKALVLWREWGSCSGGPSSTTLGKCAYCAGVDATEFS
jgi:hypothetical protein